MPLTNQQVHPSCPVSIPHNPPWSHPPRMRAISATHPCHSATRSLVLAVPTLHPCRHWYLCGCFVDRLAGWVFGPEAGESTPSLCRRERGCVPMQSTWLMTGISWQLKSCACSRRRGKGSCNCWQMQPVLNVSHQQGERHQLYACVSTTAGTPGENLQLHI
jgi:hypothetical protein